VFLKHNNIIKI